MEKNLEISLLCDFYGQLLSDRQRKAVQLYYDSDLSLFETAELMGITRQGVRDLIKRSERELFDYESKLGLYSRFTHIGVAVGNIRELASQLSESSDKNSRDTAKRIIAETELIDRLEA